MSLIVSVMTMALRRLVLPRGVLFVGRALSSAVPVPVEDRKPQYPRGWEVKRHDAAGVAAFKDSFGRVHDYLRISLTERCNLRCTYCMPEAGVDLTSPEDLLSDEEIVRLASVFVDKGISKVRLTGGEPLVRTNVVDICRQIKGLGVRDLAITTNGLLLKRKLRPLVEQGGVNLLNVSLDSLVPPKFELITRRRGFEQVFKSILEAESLVQSGELKKLKVNCVIKRGVNDDEILDFVALTESLNLEVRFIEFMPFDGNKWDKKSMLPYYEMVDMIRTRHPEFARTKELDGSNTVSKTWRVPGFRGQIGFISSMSDHFCGSCNRLRLTADGNIKACLFGKEEVSLRDILREGACDAEIAEVIQSTVLEKHAKLGGHDSPESISLGENRSMILIGG